MLRPKGRYLSVEQASWMERGPETIVMGKCLEPGKKIPWDEPCRLGETKTQSSNLHVEETLMLKDIAVLGMRKRNARHPE